MKRHLNYGLLLFLLFLSPAIFSQMKMPQELELRLQGKDKFYDIKREIESHFQTEMSQVQNDSAMTSLTNRQRKFWNRWLYWAESHLNADGEVVRNSAERNYEAVKNSTNAYSQNARSAFGDWSHRGPTYTPDGIGRVNRIAFHPTTAAIVYAGTSAGGLWRLTWSGNLYSWACLTNSIPELSVSGIVVSHADPMDLYILTGDGDVWSSGSLVTSWGYRGSSIGVLKSTDAGATWSQMGMFPGITGTLLGFSLIQDPNNANILLAATNQGIFRTTNGGASWTRSCFTDAGGSFSNSNMAFDLEFKPGSSTTVYAAYRRGGNNTCAFFKSTNGGISFTEPYQIGGVNRMAIAVTPANSSYVYLVCGPGNVTDSTAANNTFRGVFHSTNSGDDFTPKATAPDILAHVQPGFSIGHQSNYDLAIAASNTNASIVMVGGLKVWKSENRGGDFDEMTDYFFSDPDDDDCIHPDVHDLAYNPIDNQLYAATDGGVAVSSDHGNNFSNLFNGLAIGQFYHFESVNEDGHIWGGTQDCGVQEQQSGTQFFVRAGGDGYDVLTDRIGNNDDSYMVINTSIYDDSPVGSNNITPAGETEFFPLLAMHSTNEDILYAGFTSGLYRSLERGDNWFRILNTSAIWALTSCPSNSGRVYCAGSGAGQQGLFRVDGVTGIPGVTNISSGLISEGYPGNFSLKITDIAVNPNNSAQVWVTVSGFADSVKVFFSSNSGVNWANRSGSLPNVPAHSIITDASGNTYVGTDIGVFYRNNSMSDWTPFYNDLPRVAVTGLEFLDIFNAADPPNPLKYIYASTFGRGIWRSQIYENCSPTLNLTQTLQGQQSFQVTTSLTSTSDVTGGAGTEVYFQSGNSITLTDGFLAVGGTVFKSLIRPCNSGPLYPARAAMLNENTGNVMNSHGENFGRIMEAITTGDSVKVRLRINTAETYTLQIADENGEPVYTIIDALPLAKGSTERIISTGSLRKGFYHIRLFQNDLLVHFQELVKM